MKVSVKDCLQLEAFRKCIVVAGEKHMDRRVKAVSVMDAATAEDAVKCSGSSGNMVARVLNKPLRASLEYLDPAVPPTAEIEGIQLVTEGVLTLSKTLEILRQCVSPTGEVQNLELLDAKNGAAQIAKILVERCTHLNLYIGQAINPAHQNPDLPFDLSIKFRLLEELAALARKLGRTVECYYY